jgi:transposase
MIDHEIRKAIILMSQNGASQRAISRLMNVSRPCIQRIISSAQKQLSTKLRSDYITLDAEFIIELHAQCQGYKERMHEKLKEQGIKIGYSTMTRYIRHLGLDSKNQERCERVEDKPGEEMQQDTSPYRIKVADKYTRVTGSILYLRYSKMRYLKFYRAFTRFHMKCFFHEALTHMGYCAKNCIIDNTNLAVASGTGRSALINEEMARFSNMFGFTFVAHEIGHSNRKAGNERSFWTVETNFFPGREFSSLEDLNRQALKWSTVTMAQRQLTKKKIIPVQLFENEKVYLQKIPSHLPRPYLTHERMTDQYGYIAFDGNYFWVPGRSREHILVLEYSNCLKLFAHRKEIAEYGLPDSTIKQERFAPEGKLPPRRFARPNIDSSRTLAAQLRASSKELSDYLDLALKHQGVRPYSFLASLYHLHRKIPKDIFTKAIARAFKYQIYDHKSIERIIVYQMNAVNLVVPDPKIDPDYCNRETFLNGQYSQAPDLSQYDKILTKKEDENE